MYGSGRHFLHLDPSEERFCTVPCSIFYFWIRRKGDFVRFQTPFSAFGSVRRVQFTFFVRFQTAVSAFGSVGRSHFSIFIRKMQDPCGFSRPARRTVRISNQRADTKTALPAPLADFHHRLAACPSYQRSSPRVKRGLPTMRGR